VSDIVLEECTLFSETDVTAWNANDWNTKAASGIAVVDGERITLRKNTLYNIELGIRAHAEHSLVEFNTIESFSGDALQGTGDYSIFQYNTVKNCYAVNSNHDDGFQSWATVDNPVTGIVLRNNVIINSDDPEQPFRGSLQGTLTKEAVRK